MGRVRVLVLLFALVSGLSIGFATNGANGAAAVDDEQAFVTRIGAERAAAGLPAYSVADDLVAVARRQAARMATEQRLYHNPSLASEVTGWSAVGENVGVGASVDDIHRAFMASATHREAILSEGFTEIGLGVEVDAEGSLWVVQVFRRPELAPAAASPGPGEGGGGTVRAAGSSSRRSSAARTNASAPAAAAAAASAVAAAPPVVPTTAAAPPPPVDPVEPTVTAELAGAFTGASSGGVLVASAPPVTADERVVRRGPSTRRAEGRAVTAPVGVAASLLLAVVIGLLVEVRRSRYPAPVSVWRRQRNQASISSSRSPSSTAWTFPVS